MVSRGYDTSQIEAMMNIMKDSAVYNRQASFTIGQAIQQATLGLRMENSLLTDSVGIQKNVAKMWDEYAKSIGTTANRLDDAQKRQAEFNGFMVEGGVFAGAAAGYTSTYAGQVSSLSASFYNLKVAIGNSIIPIISRILPYIQSAINALVVFFNKVATIMSLLFGVDISASATSTSDALDTVTDSTNAAADAQDNLSDSTEAAGKAAKGALAAFDDLDVLQQDTGTTGTGTTSATDTILPSTLETPSLDTTETDSSLDALKEKIEAFKKSISDFFAPMKEPLAKLKEAWNTLKESMGKALAPNEGDKEFWKTYLELLRDGVITVIGWITKGLEGLAGWIDKHPDLFKGIVIVLGIILLVILAMNSPIVAIGLAILAVLVIIGWFADNWDKVKEKVGDLRESIRKFADDVAEWIQTKVTDPIQKWFSEAFYNIKIWISEAWDKVVAVWTDAAEWIQTKVTDPIKNWFKQAWEDIKEFPSAAWIYIKGIWGVAADWIREHVTDPIKDAFGTALDWVKTKWETIFTGVKDFVKGSINSIIDFINGMISAIATGINTVVNGINAIKITIPDWVPVYGGKSWGLNIPTVPTPQIPRLATGAVIPPNSQFAAILGDNKTQSEILAPEDTIRKIVREETANSGSQNISIEFGGTMGELIRLLNPVIKQENNRVGTSFIKNKGVV
jgi:hypothetical protein